MFQVFQSSRDLQWYWRLKSKNGKIVSQSEGYKTKRGCLKGVEIMGKCVKESEGVVQILKREK